MRRTLAVVAIPLVVLVVLWFTVPSMTVTPAGCFDVMITSSGEASGLVGLSEDELVKWLARATHEIADQQRIVVQRCARAEGPRV